jgi:hypothetical protein
VIGRHALADQVIADSLGAIFREALVELVAADGIGVPFDGKFEPGMGEEDAGKASEFFAGGRAEVEFAGVKQDVGHIDDESAGGIASFEDDVELLEELLAEALALAFGFFAEALGFEGGLLGGKGLFFRLGGAEFG